MTKIWRWLLFLTAITGLISNVSSLKATSLIFGRGPPSANGTTTTSTIAPSPADAANLNASTTVVDDEYIQPNEEEGGVTRPPLTGIPQIDYVWDPNLPRELNGYNLSTYPFLSLVPDPDEIDFKCDGLHDGFYASLKYSCQLYHHCIYGIRHDFLCANFTAFDQKTFICQFVSEVNCKASPKYFFRNDALYVAATTTSTTTTTIAPPITPAPPEIYERQRPRRPLLRRRPQQQADYYEEDYEDDYIETRPARRRQPQRARTRRPEYDDYGETSQSQGRRYSDDRRPNRNRDPVYEDEEDEEVNEPVRPRNRNNGDNRRVKGDSDRKRNQNDDVDAQRPLSKRRPQQKPRRVKNEKRPKPKPQPQRYEDDEEYADIDEEQSYSSGNRFQEPEITGPKVTPTGGGGSSLFSKPRAPPRISRPVPNYEKKKFEYASKSVPSTSSAPADEAEYEEDYEEPASPIPPVERAPATQPRRPIQKKKPLPKNKQPDYQEEEDEIEDDIAPVVAPRNNFRISTPRNLPKRPSRTETRSSKPVDIYAEDDVEDDVAALPVVTPRNNLRPSLRNRANQLPKQVEGRASQRRPVVESYPDDDEEDDSIAPVQNNPISRPQLPRSKNAARPSNSAPQGESRLNRRPEPTTRTVSEYGPNKLRNSLRTSTTTTTTTTALPESAESFEEEEYEDEEFDDAPAEPMPVPARPAIVPDNQSTKIKNHRFAAGNKQDARNSNQRSNSQSSKESNSSSQESSESAEQTSSSVESTSSPVREARPVVRVIKRPFLPSRGGNPYLPRGLKPLGPVEQDANDSSEQSNPSNISGSRLTEFHPPLVSHQPAPVQEYSTTSETPRFVETNPRAKLEEILSSDLDETLNDALNPTLKPLSRSSPIGFSFKYNPSYYEQPIDRSDAPAVKINPRGSTSYYGESHQQYTRSAPSAPVNPGPATDFYADYEY